MMQGSLFETRAPPHPKREQYREPLERHPVKNPTGDPDKKGNLFWQKMHKTLEEMPVLYQEIFNYLTAGAKPENLDQFEKALRMYNRASNWDRIDFDESRGRL